MQIAELSTCLGAAATRIIHCSNAARLDPIIRVNISNAWSSLTKSILIANLVPVEFHM